MVVRMGSKIKTNLTSNHAVVSHERIPIDSGKDPPNRRKNHKGLSTELYGKLEQVIDIIYKIFERQIKDKRRNILQERIMTIQKACSKVLQTNTHLDCATVIAKGDSAASRHYWRPIDAGILDNIQPADGEHVLLPDMAEITATTKGSLPIEGVTETARETLVLPKLGSSSLVSLGQLCDDGCKVELTKTDLTVFKKGKKILKGKRNQEDRLWDIPLNQTKQSNTSQHAMMVMGPSKHPAELRCENKLAVIIRKDKTKQDLVRYLHAALFSPVASTLLQAVKANTLTSWPGLTRELVSKHLPPVIATLQGHMQQERQGLQSTRMDMEENLTKEEIKDDFYPEQINPNVKTNDVVYSIIKSSALAER